MKSIIFINPPLSLKERYGKLSFAGNTLPSLGLCWLAAVARKSGYNVKIIEASSLNLTQAETIAMVLQDPPDFVALTATSCSIISASQIANEVKASKKKVTVIVGGPHLSAIPTETMENFPCFDIGVVGEGEETLEEILKTDVGPDALAGIKGLIYRKHGKLCVTEKRPFIRELDRLPFPAWDLLTDFPRKYHPGITRFQRLPAASIVSTRGCPNKCSFCDRSIFGNACRTFSPEYVFGMIKELYHRYGIREILFEDDTFFVFKDNLRQMCENILKDNLDLSWSCLGRVDSINADLLKLMKKAGCWQIGFGIESGDQDILDRMGKNISLDQAAKAVQTTRAAGIQAKAFFILGFPGETKKTMEETIGFAKKLKLDDITVTHFTPLPGSMIYDNIGQYGNFDKDWGKMNLLESIFIPNGLTKKDIDDNIKRMIRSFYLRPRIIFNYFLRLLNRIKYR